MDIVGIIIGTGLAASSLLVCGGFFLHALRELVGGPQTDETELADTERLSHQLCHDRGICDLKPQVKKASRQLRKRLNQAIRDVPKDFGARKR